MTTLLGIAHIGGKYALTQRDYLNEGAIAARALGTRCIKVGLSLDTENPSSKLYPFHSEWPTASSLAELARTPYFTALFARDFDTFVLTTFRSGRPAGYWRTELSDSDLEDETREFESLTRHLRTVFASRKVRFVFQNWEGDWALRGSYDPKAKPDSRSVENMIRWLNARQKGVDRGRAATPQSKASVLHACEVNLVWQDLAEQAGGVSMTVLPRVHCDMISYSSWDTKQDVRKFSQAIEYLKRFKRPVAIGEFGMPETEADAETVRRHTETFFRAASDRQCLYAIYWQLYCNEPAVANPLSNRDYKGFWAIRADGSHAPVAKLFARS